jgi:hypothetical protein
MYGTDKSIAQVVEGIYARLDKLLEMYGPVERVEEILDGIADRKKQLNRLVELKSKVMVCADEHEEIQRIERQFRRYVYDLVRQKSAIPNQFEQKSDSHKQPARPNTAHQKKHTSNNKKEIVMSKILSTTAVAIALSFGLAAMGSASALAADYHTEYDAHPGYEGPPIGYEPQQSVTPEFNNPGPQLSVPYNGNAVDQLSPLMGAGQPDALGIK